MANTNSLRPVLDRNPLRSDGANYSDWLRNLRNVLKRERKEYVLTTPLPEGEVMPPEFIEEKAATDTAPTVMAKNPAYVSVQTHLADELDVGTLLIAIMDPVAKAVREHGYAQDYAAARRHVC